MGRIVGLQIAEQPEKAAPVIKVPEVANDAPDVTTVDAPDVTTEGAPDADAGDPEKKEAQKTAEPPAEKPKTKTSSNKKK